MGPGELSGGFKIGPQVSIIAGTFLAGVVDFFSAKIDVWGWRLSLGFAVFLSVVMIFGVSVLKKEEANKVEEELSDLGAPSEASNTIVNLWTRDFWQRKYTPHIIITALMPIFQQLTGISVMTIYAPVVFKSIGLSHNAAILWPIINFRVALVATCVCWYDAKRWGGKLLILLGSVSIFLCSLAAYILTNYESPEKSGNPPRWYAVVFVVLNCIYVTGFTMSWGALGLLVPSEIYPVEIRSAAQSLSFSLNMLATFLSALLAPLMLCHFMRGLYAFFASFALVMIPFTWFLLPDTKGVPLEEMSLAWKKIPVWGRFIPNDDVRSEPVTFTGDVSGIGNSDIATAVDVFDTCTDTDMSDTATDIEEGKLTLDDNIRPPTEHVVSDVFDANSSYMSDIDSGELTRGNEIPPERTDVAINISDANSSATTDTDISDTASDLEMGKHSPYDNRAPGTTHVAIDV